jgi:hypothetical protein
MRRATKNDIDGVLYPGVPRVTSYGPKISIQLVPSSNKWLGNQVPHTRYGPTILG